MSRRGVSGLGSRSKKESSSRSGVEERRGVSRFGPRCKKESSSRSGLAERRNPFGSTALTWAAPARTQRAPAWGALGPLAATGATDPAAGPPAPLAASPRRRIGPPSATVAAGQANKHANKHANEHAPYERNPIQNEESVCVIVNFI